MKEDLLYFPGWEEPFILELAEIYRGCSPVWVLEQVVRGTGTVIVDNLRYTASAGDCYLLPQGASHHYFSDSNDPWVKIFMNVRGKLPAALFSAYGLSGQVIFPGACLEPEFRQFYRLAGSGMPEAQQACSLKFHQICAKLGRLADDQPQVPPEAAAMKAYLDQNVSRLVSVAELAGQIFRSPDYASKLFKGTYGITPYAYLLNRKMELACRLLQSTALSVQEIAARLGYEDAHYFSGLFRRAVGQTPSGYRKRG